MIPRTPGRADGTIERSHLLEQLGPDEKIILISAPPGYGKSTLASQYARETPHRAIWQTIRPTDVDVSTLYLKACDLLSKVFQTTRVPPDPMKLPANELAAKIALYLEEHLAEPLIYVLDDFHLLDTSTAAIQWIRILTDLSPPAFQIVLTSRTIPTLPFAEMVARGQITVIDQEQLKFQPDEVERLAAASETTLSLPEVQAIARRLDGWPAGIALALRPLPAMIAREILGGQGGPEALFRLLATNLLETQPRALQTFLLTSSTLDQITAELCESGLYLQDSLRQLQEVERRNLFVTQVGNCLRYHSLFREFLQEKLFEQDPEWFRALHVQAAQWFSANEKHEEAINHLMKAGEAQQAAYLADHVATDYFIHDRVETLLHWGDVFSKNHVEAPELFYRCAIILADRYQYESAEEYLERAIADYSTTNGDNIVRAEAQRVFFLAQRGQHGEAIQLAEQLLPKAVTDEVLGRLLRFLGYAQLQSGHLDDALHNLELALPIYRASGDTLGLTNLLMTLQLAYMQKGRLDDVSESMQEVVALRRAMGGSGALAQALNNLGYHHYLRGNYQEARDILDEGWAAAASVMDRRTEAFLRSSLAALQRDRGAFEEALSHYEAALQLASGQPYLGTRLLLGTAILHRWVGRSKTSLKVSQQAGQIAKANGLAAETIMAQAAEWAARAYLGEVEEADLHLGAIAVKLRESGNHLELLRQQAVRAYVSLMRSDPKAAHDHLAMALSIAGEAGTTQPLVAEILRTPQLVALIEQNRARYTNLLEDLERLRQAQIADLSSTERASTYRVRVYTLGQEIIRLGAQEFTPDSWRTNAAREIFFLLYFNGPQTREQIGVMFWPEADSKQVRSRVNTAIYHCRALLGSEIIQYEDSRYSILVDADIWSDVESFETYTSDARLLPTKDARTEEVLHKAVDLYHGDFLPLVDAGWADLRRSALRERYLEALVRLGRCAEARGDARAALEAYRHAASLDPFRESIHQDIMCQHMALDDRSGLVAHYKSIQELFRDELGIELSAETVRLFNSLLS